jgi:hypothetical protein
MTDVFVLMMFPWSHGEGKMRTANERIQTASPADAGKSWRLCAFG